MSITPRTMLIIVSLFTVLYVASTGFRIDVYQIILLLMILCTGVLSTIIVERMARGVEN